MELPLSYNNIYGTMPFLNIYTTTTPTGTMSSSYSLKELDVRCNYLTGTINDVMSLLSLHFQYLKVLKLDYNQFNGSMLSYNNNHDNNTDSNITTTTIINSTSSSMLQMIVILCLLLHGSV